MNHPKISVIVPVYNTEKYLHRCIDSILTQTFTDFELLLIDDGSLDRSGAICDEYAEKDSCVRVFHKSNGGVSSARNLGLDYAKGEWITFVDSDDWVSNNVLEEIIKDTDNYDLIIEYATIVNHPTDNDISIPDITIDEFNFDLLFSECHLSWRTSPWGKLFRRDLVELHSLRFQVDMSIGEDAVFLYTYLLFAKRIRINNNRNYYYLYDSERSLTKRINSVNSEIYVHDYMSSAINRLIEHYNITSIKALNELYWLDASYVHRVLNSLYYNVCRREDRLSVLQGLDLDGYLNYYLNNMESYYLCLQKFLLKNRCFKLYDIMRCVIKIVNSIIG